MASNEQIKMFRPNPPPNLSKETLGVWTGWSCKGDREVAREAAAKGLHIDLVKIFLSNRKNTKVEDAEHWFQQEVLLWVDELLERKQIFRVSHVLNNIGLVPATELTKIFYKTTKRDLREYIGNHLIKLDELDEEMKQLWHLLDLILRNNILISKYKLLEDSIECLDKQTNQWKHEIASKLFLRTHDNQLVRFLSPEELWKQLLIYNDIKLIITWINIKYNDNAPETYGVSDNLLQIFKSFTISNEMINQLHSSDTSSNTRNVVLNEFSKFGIFSDYDVNNFLNILQRLNNSDSILTIYETISKTSSNLSSDKYLNLLIDFCLEKKLYHILNVCLKNFNITSYVEAKKSPHLNLINNFRCLVNKCDESVLCSNLFIVSKFLSLDLIDYFNENPFLFLSLIFFTKDLQFFDVVTENKITLYDNNLSDVIPNMINKLPLVEALLNKKSSNFKINLTFYDMLQRHLQVDVKSIFPFRFDGHSQIPHFNSKEIAQTIGYSKKMNYIFYIKQCRPSIACKTFIINQFQNSSAIKKIDVDNAAKKTYKIALGNFTCLETTSSCIAFLEMIGVESDFLRVCVKAANILLEFGHKIGFIQNLFSKIDNDPEAILNLLECTLSSEINTEVLYDGKKFVQALKIYETAVKFSVCYNLKLPELFLTQCASNNFWLPFLIFAQIKNYPIEQIKQTLQSLKNPNLLEHIMHSVIHDIQVDEQNILMKERDSRKYFLSRIGVRKSIDTLNQNSDSIYSSITSYSSCGSGGSSTGSDFLEIDILNTKATLLQTLIRCHNSTDPPKALLHACQLYRNPLLVIFATSYEPDSVITNWLTWLAVSAELYQTVYNFESISICAKSVATLLDNCMRKQFPTALLQSFEIFIPNNALKPFIEFLNLCINKNFDVKVLSHKLELFKNLLAASRRNSVITQTDHEMTYLNNKLWIESTALLLLASAIEYNCKSLHEKALFLEIVCKIKLQSFVSCDCPSFENLLAILKILTDCKGCTNFNISQAFDNATNRKVVVECINELLDNEMFDSALKVAQVESLALDLILIKEWECKFNNRNFNEDTNFWTNSDMVFTKYNVTADCVIEFYLDCLEKIQNNLEKYQLLKFSYEWSCKYELSNRYDLEKKLWLAFVNLDEKNKDISMLKVNYCNLLYKEMMNMIDDISVYEINLESDNLVKVEKVLNESLNLGNFFLALKLEKMFSCKSSDLEILKLCYSLAEGITMPYQLNTEQRLLLTKGARFRKLSNRRTFLSARLSSYSSAASHSPATSTYVQPSDGLDAPLQDTLTVLQSLSEKLKNGPELAHRIFLSYRISINIEIPYHVVVSNTDYMKMLKDALADDCMNKLEVVHDFTTVYKWSKDEIADFFCEEIVNAASHYIQSKTDIFVMWDLNIDQEFHLVLQILHENCSLLGYKIYSYASALHNVQLTANTDFRISELALVTILLVAAHDCFTADCNMEGISIILKKCQSVISHLLTLRSWKLIVRLLTGVARYTEMNYVFQILKENDQFEFLLRKGSRKDNGLKIALLEYLKKYCPDNRELYKLVALHFALFSEVALLWEREAQSVIRNLIAISKLEMQNNKLNPEVEPFVLLTNTDGTRICLNKAIENYTHATEFHLQGEKLAKAMNSAKQAELLALQISLLKGLPNNGTTNCLLNLSSSQIAQLIYSQLSFGQSLLLVSTYNYTADWAAVLFEQCIVKNDPNYLENFLQHLSLTDALVHDVSRKFLGANLNTPNELRSMKNLIIKLPSVHTKYRIASELGFTDLVEDLLAGGQLAYLKDTVWKKGYKS